MNKLPSIKHHEIIYISNADFFAILRFEKKHPELFFRNRQQKGLLHIQMEVFNELFYGPYADEFKHILNHPED